VPSAVHLDGIRCTGDAHGGCQAECLLFWKEAWLKPVDGPATIAPKGVGATIADLDDATRNRTQDLVSTEPVYSCQATRIPKFTVPLRSSELDQYVEAYVSRNYRFHELFAPVIFRAFDRMVRTRLGRGGVPQRLYDIFQKIRGGIPYPNRPGLIPPGEQTPRGERLNLQPGEVVRVKSLEEIRKTINHDCLNRGLLFSQELVPYCGQVFRVHSRVNRIIDEKNGKMLHFKNDCIILENVICQARYNAGLQYCPRANYPYWREIWLERVPPEAVPAHLMVSSGCSGSAS